MLALLVTLYSWMTITRSESIEFGFTTAITDASTNNNASKSFTSNINMTLYWQDEYRNYRFQCTLSPPKNSSYRYFYCNTTKIEFVDECDINTNTLTNPVEYGLQIDNKHSNTINIDYISIIVSELQLNYTFTSICTNTSTTNAAGDTVTDQCSNMFSVQPNKNYLFTFDADASYPQKLHVIKTDEYAECIIPDFNDYTYEDTYGYDDDFYNEDTYEDPYFYNDEFYDQFNEYYGDINDIGDIDYDTNVFANVTVNNNTNIDTNLLDSNTNYDSYIAPIGPIDSQLLDTGNIIMENVQYNDGQWPEGQMLSIYIANIDVSCGGTITNISVTDNEYYENKWIDYTETVAYNEDSVYFFTSVNMILHPMNLPIGIKITKTMSDGTTETLIGNDIITSFDGGAQFDIGSNFCMVTKDKSDVQKEDPYVNDKNEGSVEKDKKHTNIVLIIIAVALLAVGLVGVYWVYNRHRQKYRQKLLFMEQEDTHQKVDINLMEI